MPRNADISQRRVDGDVRLYATPLPLSRLSLSPAQREFCRAYVRPELLGDPLAAVVEAYPKLEGRPIVARRRLAWLLRRSDVRSYIRHMREQAAALGDVTPARVVSQVARIAEGAFADGDGRLALDALKTLARWMGVEGSGGDGIDVMRIAESAAAGAAAGAAIGSGGDGRALGAGGGQSECEILRAAVRRAVGSAQSVIDVPARQVGAGAGAVEIGGE